MNILVTRMSSMGDIIHTWPAITDLISHIPDVKITWLVEESFVDIACLHQGVQSYIPIAIRRWRNKLFEPKTWKEWREFLHHLRSTPWDLIVDSQGLIKSAIPARLARGLVVGYSWSSSREALASLFYHKTIVVDRNMSAINRNRYLFGKVFGYEPLGRVNFGDIVCRRLNWLSTDKYAVMLHATSRFSKEWPEKYWIELGSRLWQERKLICMLPWCSLEEQKRAQRMAAAIPHAQAVPPTTLKETASLIKHASVVVGVDTGLTHLANALNIPLVAIYCDTDPLKTGVIETPRAKNLGNIGECPRVEEVCSVLNEILSP